MCTKYTYILHWYFATFIKSKVKQQGHNLGKYSVHISFLALSHKLFHQILSNLANICRKYTYIFYPTYKVKGQTARSQFRYIFCSHQFFGLISQTISLSPVKLMYKQLMLRKCIYINILPQSRSKVKQQVHKLGLYN